MPTGYYKKRQRNLSENVNMVVKDVKILLKKKKQE